MLRADAEAHKAGGDGLQDGEALHQADDPGHPQGGRAGEHRADDAVLDGDLQALRRPGREAAALLNACKVVLGQAAFAQRRGQDVGRRDRA